MKPVAIVLIAVGVVAVLIAAAILLYIFVFSHNAYKKQVRDLERKFSYFDALLMGQDSQYIHHLEIVSRTNLLYVEKYNTYSKKFKEIFENDDKFAESMVKQLNSLIASNQYKNIKVVIADARKAIAIFEEAVNNLDAELYEIVKPEEEARQAIIKLKEQYRRVKQIFYSNSNDLELVANSFNKVFEKLDTSFVEFENHIESAEYEEANELLPTISKVIIALEDALSQLPNLCIMVQSVLPEKIEQLSTEYQNVERKGVPLFNLSFRHRVDDWKKTIEDIKKQLISLQTKGVNEKIDRIQKEIESTRELLNVEVDDKAIFEEAADKLYKSAISLEKEFLKICSLLPDVEKVYIISSEQKQHIEELKESMNKMGGSKRTLDNFIHSGTKQPYSILRKKLDDLQQDYSAAYKGLNDFKTYIDSLRNSCEEAYSLIFVYFYRTKQSEALLREIGISKFAEQYSSQIEACYELLNDIDRALKVQPIDVELVNDKVEQLKNVANQFFDEIDNKYREEQLAESAIVYANRDRNHQADVHQQLSVLEDSFFEGEFVRVYHDANAIYRRMHVEEAGK
jgi:septation ring formation regulator EzrA